MPFQSKAQMRYLYAKEPAVAKKWAKEYPNQNTKDLPSKKLESKLRNKKG